MNIEALLNEEAKRNQFYADENSRLAHQMEVQEQFNANHEALTDLQKVEIMKNGGAIQLCDGYDIWTMIWDGEVYIQYRGTKEIERCRNANWFDRKDLGCDWRRA